MTRLDLDKLKESAYDLFQIASRASGLKTGMCEIEIGDLKIFPETRLRLAQASLDQEAKRTAAEKAAAAPPPEPPKPAEPLPPQINFKELEAEQQRDIKRRADEARAIARLNEWNAAGLEDTQENADAIKQFVENSEVHGYWSSEIVDAAVQNLGERGTRQLRWRKAAPPPAPPAPAAPTEVLEPWQLPLDADERTMRKASTKALLDLNLRRRKATNQIYNHRGHGVSF